MNEGIYKIRQRSTGIFITAVATSSPLKARHLKLVAPGKRDNGKDIIRGKPGKTAKAERRQAPKCCGIITKTTLDIKSAKKKSSDAEMRDGKCERN
jgi:hypothetical protein